LSNFKRFQGRQEHVLFVGEVDPAEKSEWPVLRDPGPLPSLLDRLTPAERELVILVICMRDEGYKDVDIWERTGRKFGLSPGGARKRFDKIVKYKLKPWYDQYRASEEDS